jgi:hypothetical protein
MSLDGQTNTNVTSLQQEQQTTTVPVFNPSVVSRSYTNSQWTMKEDWYVDRVNKLTIPLSPTPADIANVANDLERLLVTARLDMSFIEQSYDKYELLYKLQEKIIYNDLYNYNVGVTQGQKLTVAEREGYVASIIKNTPWDGGKLSLFDLRSLSRSRYTFMEGVIKALADKKDLLITHSSVIKTEASLNGMGNSVPNNGYRRS